MNSTTPSGAASPLSSRQHSLRGIVMLMTAVLIFAMMDTIAKHLGRSYPVPMLVWARYFIHIVFMLLVFAPRMGTGIVRSARLRLQVLRALLLVLCTGFFFTALRYLPIAEATAIGYVSPFLLTAFSGPLLGERVSRRQWMAVGVGFIGVLIIVRPGGGLLQPAAALPIAMAVCYSLYQILTRKLAASEHPVVTLFYTALVGGVVTSVVLPFYWVAPTLAHWGLMLLLGTGGVVGHYVLIKAFEHTPASVLAPFGYTQILWVTMLGYAVFGDFPDAVGLLGMAVIVACGLYCAWVARSHATMDSATVINE
jgi:drug/metabolite transporter (DMT)-like permease